MFLLCLIHQVFLDKNAKQQRTLHNKVLFYTFMYI